MTYLIALIIIVGLVIEIHSSLITKPIQNNHKGIKYVCQQYQFIITEPLPENELYYREIGTQDWIEIKVTKEGRTQPTVIYANHIGGTETNIEMRYKTSNTTYEIEKLSYIPEIIANDFGKPKSCIPIYYDKDSNEPVYDTFELKQRVNEINWEALTNYQDIANAINLLAATTYLSESLSSLTSILEEAKKNDKSFMAGLFSIVNLALSKKTSYNMKDLKQIAYHFIDYMNEHQLIDSKSTIFSMIGTLEMTHLFIDDIKHIVFLVRHYPNFYYPSYDSDLIKVSCNSVGINTVLFKDWKVLGLKEPAMHEPTEKIIYNGALVHVPIASAININKTTVESKDDTYFSNHLFEDYSNASAYVYTSQTTYSETGCTTDTTISKEYGKYLTTNCFYRFNPLDNTTAMNLYQQGLTVEGTPIIVLPAQGYKASESLKDFFKELLIILIIIIVLIVFFCCILILSIIMITLVLCYSCNKKKSPNHHPQQGYNTLNEP